MAHSDEREPTRRRTPIPTPKSDKEDAYALQALERGEADPEQQKRAIQWIIREACAFYKLCNEPESDRLSAIFDGRRFVGAQIIKLIFLNVTRTEEKRDVHRTQNRQRAPIRPSADPKYSA